MRVVRQENEKKKKQKQKRISNSHISVRMVSAPLDVAQLYSTLSKTNIYFKKKPQKAIDMYYELLLNCGDIAGTSVVAKDLSMTCHAEISPLDVENLTTYVKLMDTLDSFDNSLSTDQANHKNNRRTLSKEKLLLVPDMGEYVKWSTKVEKAIKRYQNLDKEKKEKGNLDAAKQRREQEVKSMASSSKEERMSPSMLPDISSPEKIRIKRSSEELQKDGGALSFLDFYDNIAESDLADRSASVGSRDMFSDFVKFREKENNKLTMDKQEKVFQDYISSSTNMSRPKSLYELPSLGTTSSSLHSASAPSLVFNKPNSNATSKTLLRKLSRIVSRDDIDCHQERIEEIDSKKVRLIRKLSRLCSRDDINVKESEQITGKEPLSNLRRSFSRQLSRMASGSYESQESRGDENAHQFDEDKDDIFA